MPTAKINESDYESPQKSSKPCKKEMQVETCFKSVTLFFDSHNIECISQVNRAIKTNSRNKYNIICSHL